MYVLLVLFLQIRRMELLDDQFDRKHRARIIVEEKKVRNIGNVG